MVRAFELAGARVKLLHVDRLIAAPRRVDEFDLVGLPGGFSYGDDIASGRVLAIKLRDRLGEPLRKAVARGVPIIGVCNGFQALVQTGLLPGDREENAVALAGNAGDRFIDRWVGVDYPESRCVWTEGLQSKCAPAPGEACVLPIAHGEGRFVASGAALDRLEDNGQIAVRYTDTVNGSMRSIAGICDETGLVFGLMPHPERFASWLQHPSWTRLERAVLDTPTPGLAIFRNAVERIATASV